MRLRPIVDILDEAAHVVGAMIHDSRINESANGISRPIGVCNNVVHVLFKIGNWRRQHFFVTTRSWLDWRYDLLGVEFIGRVAGLEISVFFTTNVHYVNVKTNVSKLAKFLLGLLREVKLFVLAVKMLKPMPDIAFKCVEKVVIM